jgi:pyruvoyl-dependent arginine decarboxylase (PvlArgDC)
MALIASRALAITALSDDSDAGCVEEPHAQNTTALRVNEAKTLTDCFLVVKGNAEIEFGSVSNGLSSPDFFDSTLEA